MSDAAATPWLTLRRAATLLPEPWRNGGGQTLTLLVDSATPPGWRLSRAELATDVGYSTYTGYRRSQLLLDGGPVSLYAEDALLGTLGAPGQVLEFDGAEPVRAQLEAPAQVCNGFVRPEFGSLRQWLRPVVGTLMLPCQTGALWLGHVLGGQMRVRCGHARETLHQGDAFIVHDTALPRALIEGGGTLVLARLLPATTDPADGMPRQD